MVMWKILVLEREVAGNGKNEQMELLLNLTYIKCIFARLHISGSENSFRNQSTSV